MPTRDRAPDRDERTTHARQGDAEASPASSTPEPDRRHRRPAPRRRLPQAATRREKGVTGVVGDQSEASTARSGDDTRKRGWYWHWNSIVTQYAPLIGLKGVGLLNSYTVWTDRREESPTKGYAFPSQQSEAAFYGEDRAELITINKILVALDLIEIRKEMVLRTDDKGRRWRVPHNFYRVKDQGEGFTLTTDAVRKVVELADRDAAVYRYVRRIFSPKFAPIDGSNAWHGILAELRPTETWQRLAARTEKTEKRASARSKAGHASRRAQADGAGFSLPSDGDTGTPETTAVATGIDSGDVGNDSSNDSDETSVASTNRGSGVDVARANSGSALNRRTGDAPANRGRATSVQPSNRTYHQEPTTTTDDQPIRSTEVDVLPETPPPVRLPARERAIRRFEEANDRPATRAEQRLLAAIARDLQERSGLSEMDGWQWVGDAVDEAVAAGSAYVAPRRVGEIVIRWSRDGRGDSTGGRLSQRQSQDRSHPVTGRPGVSHRSAQGVVTGRDAGGHSGVRRAVPGPRGGGAVRVPEFPVPGCGLTSQQVWSAVIGELERSGAMPRVDIEAWLRNAAIVAADEEAIVLGMPHALAEKRAGGRYLSTLVAAVERVTGVRYAVRVVRWTGDEPEENAG
jgi:hypothetical protein